MTAPGATSRGRLYRRKFDYDEARARHAAGESCAALATDYGVSAARVYQVVNEEHGRRVAERARMYASGGRCVECGAQVWRPRERCVACASIARATTVRARELQCSRCREWKPDEAFPSNRAEAFARRGRHGICRDCQTVVKRDYRRRNRERANAYDRAYKARRRAQAGAEDPAKPQKAGDR